MSDKLDRTPDFKRRQRKTPAKWERPGDELLEILEDRRLYDQLPERMKR